MAELCMTMNVRTEYTPGQKDIQVEIEPKDKTYIDVALKSELFGNVCSASGESMKKSL